jgi:dUTP pyrophosphatase
MGSLTSKVIWGTPDEPADLNVPVTLTPDATLPDYATTGAAAMDLHAAERVQIFYDTPVLVETGVSIALPYFLYGQIQGRSGLALKKGIRVHPGVIDCDYRGTIKVLMTQTIRDASNEDNDEAPPAKRPRLPSHTVEKGDRIAQLLFLPVARPGLQIVDTLPATERGTGGFGSTGTAAAAQPAEPVTEHPTTVAINRV